MTTFKVGDRVRLTENYSELKKGFESTVVKVVPRICKDISRYVDVNMRQAKQLVYLEVNKEGKVGVFDFRLELVNTFKPGQYWRNKVDTYHVCRVDTVEGDLVNFTVVKTKLGSFVGQLGRFTSHQLLKIWEPCEAPKVKVKKSGWVIHFVTKLSGLPRVESIVFATEEAAREWAKFHTNHGHGNTLSFIRIEWEEEISHGDLAKVEDDDMV